MTHRLPRFVALVAALAFAATACSTVAGEPSGAGSPSGATAAPGASGPDSAANPGDSQDASPAPSRSGDVYAVPGGPCRGEVRYSNQTGEPGGTYIRAATTPQVRWGDGCDRLNAGDECTVGWDLAYVVLTDEAYIEFQGWTNTGTEPFVSTTIGPIAYEGRGNKWPFEVTIPKAEEVIFRLVLRDSHKTAVAISDGYLYKVDCVAPLPSST